MKRLVLAAIIAVLLANAPSTTSDIPMFMHSADSAGYVGATDNSYVEQLPDQHRGETGEVAFSHQPSDSAAPSLATRLRAEENQSAPGNWSKARAKLASKIDLATDEFLKGFGGEAGKSLGKLVGWGPLALVGWGAIHTLLSAHHIPIP